ANRYWSDAHRLRPVELVREYQKTILDELDLLREAGNASQLKRNFAGSHLLYVPEVYWDHCRKNVMVMERVHGVLISDMAELQRRGANIQRLPRAGCAAGSWKTASRSSSRRRPATTSSTRTGTRATSSCCSTIRSTHVTPPSTSA